MNTSIVNQPPSNNIVAPSEPTFGLEEERYAENAFHLLITCIFLNKTRGERAIPQLRPFLEKYDTPEKLADAEINEVLPFFQPLGLQRRTNWVIFLARKWCKNPPQPYRIHRKSYKGTVKFKSEIAHLTGVGVYANDAWRIFCKDSFYELENPREPEWKRVAPKDKQLRAYLTWKWEKEGYRWDPETGIASPIKSDDLSLILQRLDLGKGRSKTENSSFDRLKT